MSVYLEEVCVRHAAAHRRDRHALADISLRIAAGEQVALIGPSGAGKTTLLHTLAGARQHESGTLQVLEADPWGLSNNARHQLRARLFLAPQTPPLPPRQRVVTAVLAGRLPQWSTWQALRSLMRPQQAELAFDALARFGLEHKLYARVDRLSGGERQRCGLARLLVSQAQLFLVDEPLSALDPALSLQTLQVLQQEASKRQATLLCSLHQVDLARAHFPRLIGLRDGCILFDAPRAAVSDAMVEALYRGAPGPDASAEDAEAFGAEPETLPGRPAPALPAGRCF